MIRERLANDLKSAIADDDPGKIATLRLICAAIKDRDLAEKAGDNTEGVSDREILELLQHMLRRREENASSHEEAGCFELARQEAQEATYIRAYLPRQFSDSEIRRAIDTAIAETGAESVRDISRVMAHLKTTHAGRMDFQAACATVKESFL